MKTYTPSGAGIARDWYVVDAQGQTLGRLGSEIAQLLRGKHKPTYTPFLDMGDFVIVVNAEKIEVTGNKAEQQVYYRHTGYPGGIKSLTYNELKARNPAKALELTVKGMLPKNRLGAAMFRKLKVYPGAEHPHEAQQPKPLQIHARVGRRDES